MGSTDEQGHRDESDGIQVCLNGGTEAEVERMPGLGVTMTAN